MKERNYVFRGVGINANECVICRYLCYDTEGLKKQIMYDYAWLSSRVVLSGTCMWGEIDADNEVIIQGLICSTWKVLIDF